MKKISLLHPFTANAIGLKEKDLYFFHSKPHENACKALKKYGYKVSIDYFTGRIWPYSKDVSGVKKVFWTVTSPIFKGRHHWRKQHSLLHFVFNLFFPPDLTIINMSGHGSLYIFKLAKQLLKKNKRYIAMIGGLHMTLDRKALTYYQQADHLIVHTKAQQQELQSVEGFENIKIIVMPLGIDIKFFKPALLPPTNPINLLFVGRISRLKQIELAIETVAYCIKNKVLNIKLSIIGPISDFLYYEELKALTSLNKLDDKVFFLGSMKHDTLVHHYQQSQLLLMPSAHESFGMVMIEAMACGTPVVALNSSGGPVDIISNGIDGLLVSPDNYSNEILKLINNDMELRAMSEHARLTIVQHYSNAVSNRIFKESVELAFKQ